MLFRGFSGGGGGHKENARGGGLENIAWGGVFIVRPPTWAPMSVSQPQKGNDKGRSHIQLFPDIQTFSYLNTLIRPEEAQLKGTELTWKSEKETI